jgi:hypothetical protein
MLVVIASPGIESKVKKYDYEDFLDGLSSTTAPRYASDGKGVLVVAIQVVEVSLVVFGFQCPNHVQFVDYTKNSSIKSLQERSACPVLFI